jgi:hypothetical protein
MVMRGGEMKKERFSKISNFQGEMQTFYRVRAPDPLGSLFLKAGIAI